MVKVTVDASKLVNMLDECKSDLEIIKEAIECFNDKYSFTQITASVGLVKPTESIEKSIGYMIRTYGGM
jgi:hypothetical protein